MPGTASAADSGEYELGVKFRSDVDGYITGIRFYKGPANNGTHVGNLWSSTGTLLASAVFTDETPTGWQQVDFGTPVAITANTIYVASYHTPNGGYAFDGAYFLNAGKDSPPLHALQNGMSGGNGVFSPGPMAFPSNSFNAANYWVDVVFAQSLEDQTAPEITPDQVHDARQLARHRDVGDRRGVEHAARLQHQPLDPDGVALEPAGGHHHGGAGGVRQSTPCR